jgi:DNA invertase Pin-like site-specific DNA recombinase
MIYGYIRVSTDEQTTENQRFEILKYTDEKHLSVDRWIEETVSAPASSPSGN